MNQDLLPEKIQEQITTSGIADLNLAESIASNFVPFMGEITELTDRLKGLELGNKEHAEIAKRVNIDLGKIRSRKNEVKKTQKEYYLNVGRFIDSLSNVNEGLIVMGQDEAQKFSKYFERMEAERIAKLKEDRNALMSQYSEIEIPNLELLTEEVFEKMLANYKLAHEAKIEAERQAEAKRLEDERIEKEKQERADARRGEILPYYSFFEVPAMQIIGDLTEEEYQEKLSEAKQAKSDHEAEQERIRLENLKLKRQADEKAELEKKQKEITEARNKELQPYIAFIRDYSKMLGMDEKSYKKEFAQIKKGAEDHWEFERKQKESYDSNRKKAELTMLKLGFVYGQDGNGMDHTDAGFVAVYNYSSLSDEKDLTVFIKEVTERVEKAKAFNEQARKNAEEASRKQAELDKAKLELEIERRRQADQKATDQKAEEDRIQAEKELLKSGDKNRLDKWVSGMVIHDINKEGLSSEGEDLANEIMLKFESFKNWATRQVINL